MERSLENIEFFLREPGCSLPQSWRGEVEWLISTVRHLRDKNAELQRQLAGRGNND